MPKTKSLPSSLSFEQLERRHCLSGVPQLAVDFETKLVSDPKELGAFVSTDSDVFFFEQGYDQLELWRINHGPFLTIPDRASKLMELPSNTVLLGEVGDELLFTREVDGFLPIIATQDQGSQLAEPIRVPVDRGPLYRTITGTDGSLAFDLGERIAIFVHSGPETDLWVTDGTTDNTRVIQSFRNLANNEFLSPDLPNAVQLGGQIFFSAPFDGREAIWQSDGSEEGTTVIHQTNLPWIINPATQELFHDQRFAASRFSDNTLVEANYGRLLKSVNDAGPHTIVGQDIYVGEEGNLWRLPADSTQAAELITTTPGGLEIQSVDPYQSGFIITTRQLVWTVDSDQQWQLHFRAIPDVPVFEPYQIGIQTTAGAEFFVIDGGSGYRFDGTPLAAATQLSIGGASHWLLVEDLLYTRHERGVSEHVVEVRGGRRIFDRRNTLSSRPHAVFEFQDKLVAVGGGSNRRPYLSTDGGWHRAAAHFRVDSTLLTVRDEFALVERDGFIRQVFGPRRVRTWPVRVSSPDTLATSEDKILMANPGSIFGAHFDGQEFQSLDVTLHERSVEPRRAYFSGKYFYFFATPEEHSPALYRSDGTLAGTQRIIGYDELPSDPRNLAASGGVAYFTTGDSREDLRIWAIRDSDDVPEAIATLSRVRLLRDLAGYSVSGHYILTSLGTWIGDANGNVVLDESSVTFLGLYEDEVVLGIPDNPDERRSPYRTWITENLQLTPDKVINQAIYNRSYRAIGNRFFFTQSGATWESDGTPNGTRAIADRPLDILHADKGYIYFANGDTQTGVELWKESRNPFVRGDVNLDGVVSFTDFLILANNFSRRRAEYQMGDLDGSGTVDFTDFLILSSSVSESDVNGIG